ncbi:Golgi-associated kinase 1B [Lampris incognitus]|uniref:Golgi-associated kinase 1B n=1 Tax=Lampris incognitus TaxID=2546036 RepID=UPI0024B5FE2A|nr:Golgi-associated kinase 1B [Lampris incognitus]
MLMERRFLWSATSSVKLASSFRRCPPLRRDLILASLCLLYVALVFLVSHGGHAWSHGPTDKIQKTVGLFDEERTYHLDYSVPPRSNVVYITLRSKRLKPAVLRGTVRPKRRRKVRRTKADKNAFTQTKADGTAGTTWSQRRPFGPKTPWKEVRDIDYRSLDLKPISQSDPQFSSIRIYSQSAPPWFSAQDVAAMRFLSSAKVARVKAVSYQDSDSDSDSVLLFESETNPDPGKPHQGCLAQCGIINRPVDASEVFAFHLDRVLGLNRTLPAVSRRFRFLHDGRPCPVVSWDASVYPQGRVAGRSIVRLTWGDYQKSLTQRCWYKNTIPKPESGCSTIHHYEWSKLALFDFLLQIYHRLDLSCCGFKPRQEDACMERGLHSDCADRDHIQLANIIHRGHDPQRLVFSHNTGFFDRGQDNLDFRLLDGIKELPAEAVEVLRSRRLRQRLLQSLFLDQTYWESQGGRQGIDKLIDVIEGRANVLLTFINAHGVKIIPMNE